MKEPIDHRTCSVARTLMILGDRWIFLILRESFFGVRYYDQFRANLGIATNILSDRLRKLVDNGILEKSRDPDDARRVRYHLTEKGTDLYPITLAFMNWGDKWLEDGQGPPLRLFHRACGQPLTPVMRCAHCGGPVDVREVSYEERVPVKPRSRRK